MPFIDLNARTRKPARAATWSITRMPYPFSSRAHMLSEVTRVPHTLAFQSEVSKRHTERSGAQKIPLPRELSSNIAGIAFQGSSASHSVRLKEILRNEHQHARSIVSVHSGAGIHVGCL